MTNVMSDNERESDDTPAHMDDVRRRAVADEQRVIMFERCEALLERWAADDRT